MYKYLSYGLINSRSSQFSQKTKDKPEEQINSTPTEPVELLRLVSDLTS